MITLIRKTGLKLGLIISVLMIFALVSVNTVFADDSDDSIQSKNKNYVQTTESTDSQSEE